MVLVLCADLSDNGQDRRLPLHDQAYLESEYMVLGTRDGKGWPSCHPVGRLPKLRTVELLGELPVDPAGKDFFQAIVEERKRAEAAHGKADPRAKGLKVLANATSYGTYAQMTRHQLPDRQRETVRVSAPATNPTRQRSPHPRIQPNTPSRPSPPPSPERPA